MEVFEKQQLIASKLQENGWSLEYMEMHGRCEVIAKKRWARISITTEECECHGGRMWINEEHTQTHYEISHPEYDEELGIVDSSTELRWIIENEMMEYVSRLDSVVYKLVKINEWGIEDAIKEEKVTYYSSMSSLAHAVTDDQNVKDIFAIDSVKHQYPNPNIYCVTERIHKETKYSWEQGRIWFKQTRYERKNENDTFRPSREYEMYVDIFNKFK